MKKIILVVVIAFIFASCSFNEGINADETNQNCVANVLTKQQLADLLYTKDLSGIQFIDIRTPHKFSIGHLPNAINIPISNFFDKERFKAINQGDMLVIYGEDASSPKMMGLLASHFNKGSFYTAGGGYDYIVENITNGFGLNSSLYDDEIPLVDYQKVIDEIKAKSGASVSTEVKKKAVNTKPIIKRKKKEVSGGCG
ncbi:MAG TPA: rhodanese-like domain-containing protein [Lutibacter sp.]|nr:rhodanese-like domain-containing protein [Lutibacter sp.]